MKPTRGLRQKIRFFTLLSALLCCTLTGRAQKPAGLPPGAGKPIQMQQEHGQTYLVTSTGLLLLKKSGWTTVLIAPAEVRGAWLHGKEIILATGNGLYHYADEHARPVRRFADTTLQGCAGDAMGNLWVATEFNGVWVQDCSGAFRQWLQVPVVYSMKTTADSFIWVGTNIGLYKISRLSTAITRFAEEGYSGYELPDNVVEQLYADRASNVWVIMPDNLSFKPASGSTGEIPTYDFIGRAGNDVLSVAEVDKQGYLFATSQGLYYVGRGQLHSHDHGGEVHSASEATHALPVGAGDIDAPNTAGQITRVFNLQNRLYFFNDRGACWSVSSRRMMKNLRSGAQEAHGAQASVLKP